VTEGVTLTKLLPGRIVAVAGKLTTDVFELEKVALNPVVGASVRYKKRELPLYHSACAVMVLETVIVVERDTPA
jgi:hypothetical protein